MAMNAVMMNFGFAVFGVTDYVGFKNTFHYGACVAKAPRDEIDILACRRLGLRLAEFVGLFLCGRPECHPLRASKRVDYERFGWPGIPPKSVTIEELSAHQAAANTSVTTFSCKDGQCGSASARKRVLIFTKMEAYIHQSSAAAASFIAAACAEQGMIPVVSADQSFLEKGAQVDFDLIVLVQNSGDIFDPAQEILSAHVAAGKGVLGVHAALACFLNGEDASGETIMKPTTHVIQVERDTTIWSFVT